MYLFSQYYPIVFTICNVLFHFKVPYHSNIIINSFNLISGTYLALTKTAWPTIDWPNGMLLSSSLLDNSVKLMVRSSFARGRIFRLQQFFLVLSRPPPTLAAASWEHNNWGAVDDCKVWYGSILESAWRCGFERQKTFEKWSVSFKKRMVGATSRFCRSCCQMVEKIQSGYKSILSAEMNACLSLPYFNISPNGNWHHLLTPLWILPVYLSGLFTRKIKADRQGGWFATPGLDIRRF